MESFYLHYLKWTRTHWLYIAPSNLIKMRLYLVSARILGILRWSQNCWNYNNKKVLLNNVWQEVTTKEYRTCSLVHVCEVYFKHQNVCLLGSDLDIIQYMTWSRTTMNRRTSDTYCSNNRIMLYRSSPKELSFIEYLSWWHETNILRVAYWLGQR